jgi:hypothetical protein
MAGVVNVFTYWGSHFVCARSILMKVLLLPWALLCTCGDAWVLSWCALFVVCVLCPQWHPWRGGDGDNEDYVCAPCASPVARGFLCGVHVVCILDTGTTCTVLHYVHGRMYTSQRPMPHCEPEIYAVAALWECVARAAATWSAIVGRGGAAAAARRG